MEYLADSGVLLVYGYFIELVKLLLFMQCIFGYLFTKSRSQEIESKPHGLKEKSKSRTLEGTHCILLITFTLS